MRLPIQIGRPQIIAGIMLIGLAVTVVPFDHALYKNRFNVTGEEVSSSISAMGQLLSRFSLVISRLVPATITAERVEHLFYIGFAVWLGGGVWWVSRRLFSDVGGYVALGLYCTSIVIRVGVITLSPDILAAWAIFGFIYTAMGIAHTSYAPPRKWPPRMVLLTIGFGIALASNSTLAWVSFVIAFGLVLYLSPAVRVAAVAVYLASSLGGVLLALFLSWHAGTPIELLWNISSDWSTVKLADALFNSMTGIWFLLTWNIIPIMAFITFACLRPARWFGTSSALLLSLIFWLIPLMALPFVAVFAGGVAADWREVRRGRVFLRITWAVLFVRFVALGLIPTIVQLSRY